MLSIFLLLVILLISYSLGRKILRAFKVSLSSFLEEFCFSCGIGFGILSFLIFALGIFRGYYPLAARLLLSLLFLFSLKDSVSLCGKFLEGFQRLKTVRLSRFFMAVVVILGAYLAGTFICSLAPVTEWDSQIHHLAVPKVFIQHHGIHLLPFNANSDYPALIQMLYVLAMLLSGDILATLVQWSICILLLLAIFAFCRRFLSARTGAFAAAVFFCCPLMIFISTQPTVDGALAFFSFLAFYAIVGWPLHDNRNMLLLSAVFSGLAAGVKYNGLFNLFLMLPVVLFSSYFVRKNRLRQVFKDVFIYAILSLAVFSPWIVKNIMLRGAPFYPFLTGLFSSQNTAVPVDMSVFSFKHLDWRQIILLPWNVSMAKYSGWADSAGFFYLAFFPLIIFIRDKSRVIKYVSLYSLAGIMVFCFLSPHSFRYMLAFLAVCAIAVAYVIESIMDASSWLKRAVPGLVLSVLLVNLVFLGGLLSNRLPVVLGLESRDAYLGRKINMYEAMRYANKNLPKEANILLFDMRGYYLNQNYIPEFFLYYYIGESDPDDLVKIHKQLGLTHVLLNAQDDWSSRRDWRKLVPENLKLLFRANNASLYQIDYDSK